MKLIKKFEEEVKEGDFISTLVVFSSLNEKGEIEGNQVIWEICSMKKRQPIQVRSYFRIGKNIEESKVLPSKENKGYYLLDKRERKEFIKQRDTFIKKWVIQSLR